MYYPIHFWYDSTKQHLADARHRLILHNMGSIMLSIKHFGDYTTHLMEDGTIIKADNYFIGLNHIREDFGRNIGTEEILAFCANHLKGSVRKFNQERALDMLIKKHQGVRSDYKGISDFFFHFTNWSHDTIQHRVAISFLSNSFGIFQLEKMLGTLFTRESDGRVIPTRIIGENYVNGGYGQIPTLNQILEGVPQRSWMQVNAAALSFQFDEAQISNPNKPDIQQRSTPYPLPLD